MVQVRPVTTRADRKAFVDLPFRLYANNPDWVPPLKSEVHALITPGKNPWFEHGHAQLFLAEANGRVTGRISAHIDHLALEQPAANGMGPGTGNWGMLEAEDAATAKTLIETAEEWLRGEKMTRVLAPLSISIWDEPGLLTFGFRQPPTIMMGYNSPDYQGWIEPLGYESVKQLHTYELDITNGFSPLINRIVSSGEKNPRIHIRTLDKKRFAEEAVLILGILNDAWSDNWGFVPLTDSEIAFVGKKLKPLAFEKLVRIAEVEGVPVAFMITLPNINEVLAKMDGTLFPFGWARLLAWFARPRANIMRVPLMGVIKELQSSRLASQLAFMMIEFIRRDAIPMFGCTHGEIGWVLDDNQGMVAIADAIDSKINKTYTLYAKPL